MCGDNTKNVLHGHITTETRKHREFARVKYTREYKIFHSRVHTAYQIRAFNRDLSPFRVLRVRSRDGIAKIRLLPREPGFFLRNKRSGRRRVCPGRHSGYPPRISFRIFTLAPPTLSRATGRLRRRRRARYTQHPGVPYAGEKLSIPVSFLRGSLRARTQTYTTHIPHIPHVYTYTYVRINVYDETGDGIGNKIYVYTTCVCVEKKRPTFASADSYSAAATAVLPVMAPADICKLSNATRHGYSFVRRLCSCTTDTYIIHAYRIRRMCTYTRSCPCVCV